jgi:CheY-like chemotaxis protein
MVPTCVDGGAAAIAVLRKAKSEKHPFPLILLDARMPEIDGFKVAETIQSDPTLMGATILMLSSSDAATDAARCRELGIAMYLVKPIRQTELRRALTTALGNANPNPKDLVPNTSTHRQTNHPRNILLAEDNPINQKLAVSLLTKWGHRITVANNGNEAFEAFTRETFDLILMDVQMPELNGFEATKLIRDREQTTGTHIPILAMTAHAMKGDKEKCLEAGMDGYVAKPIQVEELFNAIECLFVEPVASA